MCYVSCQCLNQAWPSRPRACFLEIALVHASVCVCVCQPPRPLIISGVILCDIDHVQLVKQVSQIFPAFNYFIWHLPLIKWVDVAILTQHVMNACQRKLRCCGTSYKRTTQKTERFIYKSEWVNT